MTVRALEADNYDSMSPRDARPKTDWKKGLAVLLRRGPQIGVQ